MTHQSARSTIRTVPRGGCFRTAIFAATRATPSPPAHLCSIVRRIKCNICPAGPCNASIRSAPREATGCALSLRRRKSAVTAARLCIACRRRSGRVFACAQDRWRAIARGVRASFSGNCSRGLRRRSDGPRDPMGWQRLDRGPARSRPRCDSPKWGNQRVRVEPKSSGRLGPFIILAHAAIKSDSAGA